VKILPADTFLSMAEPVQCLLDGCHKPASPLAKGDQPQYDTLFWGESALSALPSSPSSPAPASETALRASSVLAADEAMASGSSTPSSEGTQDHIEGLLKRSPDTNSLNEKLLSHSVVGACRNIAPRVRRAVRNAIVGLAPAGYKTRNLGPSYGDRPDNLFYNVYRSVLAAMSVLAPDPRRVARVDLTTIGPLYHDPGCSCSRWAGVTDLNDLDPADPPDTPSQGAVMGPMVTRPPVTAGWPATCFARHQPRAGPSPGNVRGRVSVIGFSLMPSASLSGVAGYRLALRASHCVLTDCSMYSVDTRKHKILLFGYYCGSPQRCTIMSLKPATDIVSSGSSSGEWDGLASPDVLRKYREPKWYMERGAQTDADGYAGPNRGLGIPNRPARNQAAATAQGAGACACGAYRPRRCGLCYHEHVFDTRTALNNHASQQHGYYYSLKGDCFIPLGGGARRTGPPQWTALGCCDFDPRFRGRARHVPGRVRPLYPRSVPSVRYLHGNDK